MAVICDDRDARSDPQEDGMSEASEIGVDFAVGAYREEGTWQVAPMPPNVAADLGTLVQALRQLPADAGVLGMVSVDEDHFVIARVNGEDLRLLLSDVTAATSWPLARSVVDRLGLPTPDDEDEYQPAGDLSIVADLGLGAMDLGALIDDADLYPDEMLSDIAERAGFGQEFEAVVATVST
jgi:putative tRNA adenosine deaminase-associated protein